MVIFATNSRQALTSGAAAIGAAALALLVALALAIALPVSFLTFALILLALGLAAFAVWAAFHTYALTHTSYAIDRNAFVIRWGPIREIIPMGDVQRVIAGSDIAADVRLLRLPLPGWWIGRGSHPALGKIHFFSAAPLDEQIIIVTQAAGYAVSPQEAQAFVDAFRVRFQMGPTQMVRPARLFPAVMTWPIWKSPPTLALIALPVALNALVFGVGFALFPTLPDQIALHFDAAGTPDRFGGQGQIFGPAVIGLGLALVNLAIGAAAYRRDRLAAWLAWGGSAGVQISLLIATITLAVARP
jgi:hypothetical protein